MTHRFIRIFTVLLCTLLAFTTITARSAEFKLNGHTFTLPDGFTLEQSIARLEQLYESRLRMKNIQV